MSVTHRMKATDFALLATGDGNADVLAGLRSAQLSKRILVLHALVKTAASAAPEVFSAGRLAASMSVLAAARRVSRDAVDDVLLHPQVGGWAAHCLRRLRGVGEGGGVPLADDLGYLGALAAVAALRAGMPFEVLVRVRDGGVMFPAMGLLRLPAEPSWASVHSVGAGLVVATTNGCARVPDRPEAEGDAWLPLRRLRSSAGGQRIELLLDDLDPFRIYEDLSVARRLDDAAVADWQATLDEAWDLLVRRHPARAEAVATGLVCLVPVEPGDAGIKCSATAGDAFGAAALTPPRSGLELAAALVHEVQHSKLAGVLDMLDLYDSQPLRMFYAPWRSDPRPLPALLQGAYAHLAITDFWQATRRGDDGRGNDLAHFEFARWRRAVRRTTGTLEASGALTALGLRFVAGMSARAAQLARAPVPAAPLRLARDAAADHRTAWRLRNLRVDPDQVAGWADAWLAGSGSAPVGRPVSSVLPGRRRPVPEPRLGLIDLRLRHPDRFRRLAEDPARLAAQVREATVADALYVAGDRTAAGVAYRHQVADAPDRIDLWAGLALARWRVATPAAAACPEAVRALHDRIRAVTGTGPDPDALAAWLAAAFRPPGR
jgi:HEXXH motif-containing protein